MAFQSPSDGALISPYQWSFGTLGQTKVSGDHQRETDNPWNLLLWVSIRIMIAPQIFKSSTGSAVWVVVAIWVVSGLQGEGVCELLRASIVFPSVVCLFHRLTYKLNHFWRKIVKLLLQIVPWMFVKILWKHII